MIPPVRPGVGAVFLPLVAAAALAMTAGCSVLPLDKEPTRLFVLTPKSTFDPNVPKVNWQLTIDSPLAESGLNTSRVAVMRKALSLEYFERANWVDTAPRMVHRLMVESFENSRRIVGVGRQSASLRSDYSLITELREFQAESYRSEPVVHVRLNVKMVKMPERMIVATLSAEHMVPTDGNAIEDIVRAFDASLGKVLKDVVSWTLGAVPPDSPRERRRR